jgi:hypothetical protein
VKVDRRRTQSGRPTPASPLPLPPPLPASKPEQKSREKKPKAKNEPRLVAAARELKDRWLEHVNNGGQDLLPQGKYDLTRALPASVAAAGALAAAVTRTPLLPPPAPLLRAA